MPLTLPTGRTGQLLALAIAGLALGVLWLGCTLPLVRWYNERAETIVLRVAMAQRMEALVATREHLQEQVTILSAGGAGEKALLNGDSDPVASASLQEVLQAVFLQNGVQINSVETLPSEEAGAYRRIGIRISFNASWPTLMAVLKDIQLGKPTLLIDELQIQKALHRIGTAPGTFDLSCIVFAFRSGQIRVAG